MINLIPPQIKKRRRVGIVLSHIYLAFGVITFMFVIMAGALYIYNTYLITDIARVNERIADQSKKISAYKDTEKEIQSINATLLKIDATDKDRMLWSMVLETIAASTPKNIQVKNLTLNKESMNINLSGTAATRTDIAIMKEKLETLDSFRNVTFSTSSFNQATNDYSFSLAFELTRIMQ